jgi:hypothetical protein
MNERASITHKTRASSQKIFGRVGRPGLQAKNRDRANSGYLIKAFHSRAALASQPSWAIIMGGHIIILIIRAL